MQFLRKFYDSGAFAAPAGTFAGAKASDFQMVEQSPAPTIEEPTPEQQSPTTEQTPVAADTKPESQPVSDEKVAPKPPVAVEDPKPVVKIEHETPVQPVTTEAPAVEPPVVIPPKTVEEFLKEKGYDDYAIQALNFYKQTGDLTPYVKVKSINYKDMTPEEVMRHDLREEYSELSEDALNVLYQQEIVDKYKLDPEQYSEAEVAVGKAKLKRDSAPVKAKFLENQAKFAPPERNIEAEQQAAAEAFRQEQIRQVQQVTNDPATKSLLTGKRLSFDVGDDGEQFTFEPANPADVLGAVTDGDNWMKATHILDKNGDLAKDANGKFIPNVPVLLKVSAFLKYEKQILKSMKDNAYAEALKKHVTELTNPETTTSQAPTESKSLKDAAYKAVGDKRWW